MASWFDSIWQDVRFGARVLAKSRGFSAAAAFTLALGIGANTAMFSVVYAVLLKPLPFEDPDRLVAVWSSAPGIGWPRAVLAAAQYFTYREENRVFSDVAVWSERTATLAGDGDPERVPALLVTDGFLPVLGVEPALGRRFSRDDVAPGGPARLMITYAFWQQRFGGSRAVVGRGLDIDGQPHEIIGVLPRRFAFLDSPAAIVLPLRFNRASTQIMNFSYCGLARLKPGVTLESANRDVGRMIALTPQKFPASPALGPTWFEDAKFAPDVHLLSDDVSGEVGRVLWVLMGTIGMVLLIACANVANLFLVRADARQRELAIRAALGAGRARVARALLSESLILGAAGGLLGVGLAGAAIRVVRSTAPSALPRVGEIALDPAVLAFAAALSVAAGFVFGMIPVLRFVSPRLSVLKDGGRAASHGRARHRARSALVVSEIALAVVLVTASGLMVRTFLALGHVDPGFVRGEQLMAFDIALPRPLAADAELAARRHEDTVRRILQVPGVESVGLTSSVVLEGHGMSNPLLVEDFPLPEGQAVQSRRMKWISPGYFETLGLRLIAGRSLTWADVFRLTPAIVLNERLARAYWKTPGEAVGKRVRESLKSPWREVIGVVANERQDGLGQEPPAIMYWPFFVDKFFGFGKQSTSPATYVVRSARTGSPTLLAEIRQAVRSIDRGVPLSKVRTFRQITAESTAQTSFALVMLSIAAGVSLLLGVVGTYSVISYIAAQRTREVGIRVALGAQPRDVAGLFMRHGLALAVLGVGTGVLVALTLSRLMASMLFNVSATDPLTYVAVSAGLAAIAIAAGYLPARRSARMDPVVALRSDT